MSGCFDISYFSAIFIAECSEREIETLEREIGISHKTLKPVNDQPKSPPPLSPSKEVKMVPIPRLPMPYQPGGEPGKGHINYLDSAEAMLETEFAPPDRYFAISALLGRLRDPLKLPFPPNSRLYAGAFLTKGKKNDQELEERKNRQSLDKQKALILLDKSCVCHMEQVDTTALLALHKKISSHRTSTVFRKPVNPAEGERFVGVVSFCRF